MSMEYDGSYAENEREEAQAELQYDLIRDMDSDFLAECVQEMVTRLSKLMYYKHSKDRLKKDIISNIDYCLNEKEEQNENKI